MWKKILGWLLFLGAFAAGIFFWMSRLSQQPVAVIQSHLDAIKGNDIPRAYSYFAPPVRLHMSLDQFRVVVEQYSEELRAPQASFPFRQVSYGGGTLSFERNLDEPPPGGFPSLSEAFLTKMIGAYRGHNTVAVIRGFLVPQAGKNVKVRYVLMEEPDTATLKDHWVIYDFALGKW
jgi:hypothetical protein